MHRPRTSQAFLPLSSPLSRSLHTPSLTLRHFAPKTKRNIRQCLPPQTPPPQNIAIIGAGLAGLSTTYHLLHSTRRAAIARNLDPNAPRITLFDPAPPGTSGATVAAAGLLHPFGPRVKKKAWQPVKSLDAALRLIAAVEEDQPHAANIIKFPGLLRLAVTEKLESDFRIAANRYPSEVEFIPAEMLRERFPHAPEGVCAAFLKKAAVVDTPNYTRRLWALCERTGRAEWRQKAVSSISDLLRVERGKDGKPYNTVIICAGAMSKAVPDLVDVPLTPCRGQNLIMETADAACVPDVPVIAGKYVVPDYFQTEGAKSESGEKMHRMIAGASFEYAADGESEAAFLQAADRTSRTRAMAQLRVPVHRLMPNIWREWKVAGTSVGMRALPPRSADGSIPIACRVTGAGEDVGIWLFSGLGSRGLLHHAYLGRLIAKAVVSGQDKIIPFVARQFPVKVVLESGEVAVESVGDVVGESAGMDSQVEAKLEQRV